MDFPLPVGPTTIKIPYGDLPISRTIESSLFDDINLSRSNMDESDWRALRTIFSPHFPGRVLTRKSEIISLIRHLILPSWGNLFSAISSLLITLIRLIIAFDFALGKEYTSFRTPSIRYLILILSSKGSAWISEAFSLEQVDNIDPAALITGSSASSNSESSIISISSPSSGFSSKSKKSNLSSCLLFNSLVSSLPITSCKRDFGFSSEFCRDVFFISWSNLLTASFNSVSSNFSSGKLFFKPLLESSTSLSLNCCISSEFHFSHSSVVICLTSTSVENLSFISSTISKTLLYMGFIAPNLILLWASEIKTIPAFFPRSEDKISFIFFVLDSSILFSLSSLFIIKR